MAKYFGKVGYILGYDEDVPGVHKANVVERDYFGDLTRNTRRWDMGENRNDDLSLSNDISIVMDPFAMANFHSIAYVEYMGTKWKVNNVEVNYPRLILHVGGVYNGEQAQTA